MLNPKKYVFLFLCSVGFTLWFSISCPLAVGARERNRLSLKAAFSLNDNDLWKLHTWGAWLDGYDLSPGGKTLAAEFEALQEGQRESLWIGEWDTGTGKLMNERPVEGPGPVGRLFGSAPNLQYKFDIRFTPDGHRLAVLAGPRIRVLDAETLKLLYSISPTEVNRGPQGEAVIREFLISRDNKVLLVLTSAATFPWGQIKARLFMLQDGKEVAGWTLPKSGATSFSLSPDGSELLVSSFPSTQAQAADISLVDSHSGEVERTFRAYGGEAKFLDADRIVVAGAISPDPSHHVMKIISIQTGQVVQELGYSKHDAHAWFVVAARSPTILTLIFSWKWGIGSDLDNPFKRGVDWLALFEAGQGEPLYVRHNIRPFDGGNALSVGGLRTTMRISSDGKVVAFGEGKDIKVYRVEAESGPSKTSD